jgi:pimeloyl-ACP methyl ester carboxylesterase
MITPAAWHASGQTFDWHSHSIFYRTHGHGEKALLLIHGFPTASWDWAPLWDALCARFEHIIALDMLGFGFSDKPATHRYSLIEQADIHQALLTKLGVTQAHVFAHDYGVSVAQELLARELESRPPKLLSVVLLNGGLFPETHRMTSMQKLLRSPLGFIVQWLMNERRFGKSFSVVFGPHTKPNAQELKKFWSLIRYNNGPRIMHRLIAYIAERREQRERWVNALQKTRVPIRLINGPEDPVSGAHMVARYRELIASPDVVSLRGIGHYPQTEAPQQVLQALTDFYTRINA